MVTDCNSPLTFTLQTSEFEYSVCSGTPDNSRFLGTCSGLPDQAIIETITHIPGGNVASVINYTPDTAYFFAGMLPSSHVTGTSFRGCGENMK